MQKPCVPLMMSGMLNKGIDFALDVGMRMPIISDTGHNEGMRMRDYLGFSKKMADLNEKGQYDKLLNNLAELAPAIDHFFDQVLIMTDDPEINANRLALLSEIADYVYAICDLRELVIAPKSSS